MDLVHIWASLVVLVVILYVVLDGFSLGVALLFPTAKDEDDRDTMMGTIAPVWEANQTWLVFGGGALFASFPMVYSVLFSALYIPLLTFVFGLIFRGVTFEFRANAVRKETWNRAFFAGSLVAVLAQGLTLGGYLSGTAVADGGFAGGPFEWLNPFSIMVGVALVAGYILLGATFLIMKTDGEIQERAYRQAFWAAWIVLGFMGLVTVWTPFHDPLVISRWFSTPRIFFVWSFPILGLVAFYRLIKSLRARREIMPFVCSVLLFLSAYLGLITSIYPYAIPPDVTLQEAAAQEKTLSFILWGVAIVLPVVLGYTIYSYSLFRGKVGAASGYIDDHG
jgi:cytochrome d ubiquinol oxidase subunit II